MSVPAHAQDATAPERKLAVEGRLASLKHSEAELEKLVPPARLEDVASPEAMKQRSSAFPLETSQYREVL